MSEESALQFPCRFPIKMMGRDTPEFRATAVQLIENHVGQVAAADVQTALSSKANFVSVTVTVTATSQDMLDAIYRDVSGHDDVLMAL